MIFGFLFSPGQGTFQTEIAVIESEFSENVFIPIVDNFNMGGVTFGT